MGKAYSEESRDRVKQLLQQEVAEDEIEKQTGVSDRTIRRWKLELERYGRIGKPPESRTGRHRVMNKDVEQALFDHVAQKPELSVDDMLWWLYDNYKLVVGTRTIRRAFERRNTSHKKFRNDARKDMKGDRSSAGIGAGAGAGDERTHGQSQQQSQSQVQMQPQVSLPLTVPVQLQQQQEQDQENVHAIPHSHIQPAHATHAMHAHAPAPPPHPHTHTHPPPLPDHFDSQAQAPPATTQPSNTYQSPYAPMAPMVGNDNAPEISPELARALGGLSQAGESSNIHPDLMGDEMDLSEDEETLQLQLQQIALQKKEIELKLKMRRMQRARQSPYTPRMSTDTHDQSFLAGLNASASASAAASDTSALATARSAQGATSPDPAASLKHRDSRSKSKVEEARRRTEERQERMLKDLERRSRRREHLTAEWVQSRDVWAKGPEKLLVELMHQHSTYAYNQNSLDTFEAIFHGLYQLVDHTDWYPPVHDDLLRERTRRKMSQLRSKMVKSGEIISRGEGYGGWTRSDMNIEDSLSLDQQDMQHSLHAMSAMPLDMDTLGDGRDTPSEETMLARDAMMHTPHDPNMLQHQPFQQQQQQQQNQHPHEQQQQQQVYTQDMHDPDFGQHQRNMQDAEMNRQNASMTI